MSLTCGFYDSINHDRRYSAAQFSELFDGVINDGVFMTIGDTMVVKALGGMDLAVGTGRAWFFGTWSAIDTEYPITLSASELVLDRIDAVVLEVNKSQQIRENSIKIVRGIGASNPQKPELVNTEEVKQLPLAYVNVKAKTTVITQADITNCVGTEECPFVTAILETTDIDQLFAQWKGQWDVWFADEKVKSEDEFHDWFDEVRDILGSLTVGDLTNRVIDLENTSTALTTTIDISFDPDYAWGSTAPYTQTVPVSYMRSNYRPIIQPAIPDDIEVDDVDLYLDECGFVTRFDSANGSITATCYSERPTRRLIFSVKGV